MRIGIINYQNLNNRRCPTIVKVMRKLGHDITVLSAHDDHFTIIKESKITHWIFSGSPLDVNDPPSPQVNKKILGLQDKRFLLICYSMESVLKSLGCKLMTSKKSKNDTIPLTPLYNNYLTGGMKIPISAARYHYTHVTVSSLPPRIRLQMKHKNEVMTCHYKNCVMVQWHPELSEEGDLFLSNWLSK